MPELAKVNSIDALRTFRVALARFVQEASNALVEIDTDVQRLSSRLRSDSLPHWQKELRVRQEYVAKARTAKSRKQLLSMAEMPSLIEERRELDNAKRRVTEAEQKIEAVKKWARIVDRESMLYKGQTQALSDAVSRDLPNAILRLGRMIQSLEDYTRLAPQNTELAPESAASSRAMAAMHAPTNSPLTTAAQQSALASAALRRRTPPHSVRDPIPLDQPGFVAAAGPSLPDGGLLMKLGLAGDTITPGARVVLAIGALGGGDYYVERLADDNSYFIGPASSDSAAVHYEAIAAESLVALRPALREVLELPPGYLARIASGSVQSVITALDEEVLSP